MLLEILFSIHAAQAEQQAAPETSAPGIVFTSPTAPATPVDDVQTCLDQGRKARVVTPKDCSKSDKPHSNQKLAFTSHKVDSSELPLTRVAGNLPDFKKALENQIQSCKNKTPAQLAETFRFGCRPSSCQDCRAVSRQEYCLNTNTQMLKLANDAGKDYLGFMKTISTKFDWYKSDGQLDDGQRFKKGQTQMTAYYSPLGIDASKTKTEEYRFPIYGPPKGLVQIQECDPANCGIDPVTNFPLKWCIKNGDKYSKVPTRKEINEGALGDQAPIGYMREPTDLPFLQVEGSGAVNMKMPDGTTQEVVLNYAGQNGRPRNMLSGVLRCMKVDTKKYAQSESGIRKFIKENPDKEYSTLNYDSSYVFFSPGKNWLGVDDIPITTNHTIATDPKVIPTGSVTLFNAPADEDGPLTTVPAIPQDVGGAIVGAHIDRYMGEGPEAAARANSANDPGIIFMALPKNAGTLIGCKSASDSPPAAPQQTPPAP